jgi:hypothetical protein
MALKLDPEKVGYVLLADGWHEVTSIDGKSTFAVDAYEFIEGAPTTGASWRETTESNQYKITCPLTSILAVKEVTV